MMFYLTHTAKAFFEDFDKSNDIIKNIAGYLGIAVFVILNVLLYKSEKRKKKLKHQSEENNTFITARLISSYKQYDRDSNESEYHGDYEYTVNGKTKIYRTYSINPLPDTIKMYPQNREGTKFFSDYGHDKVGAAIALNGLAAIAAVFVSYWLMLQLILMG
ncbi:MAG: hypothetical protein K2J73_09720 [Oscillospiraceae bacterium]|nr:hypothetical protein [Oscillospiraceae bacterium]